ncbi:MAG: hypothetical protein JSV43_06485 [Methanobacteriota archaeon]|nr:MAG: hypothetical protein JSV43_06485 [Euryarchaeota archaeon]
MPSKIDEMEPQAKGLLYRWLQGLSDENSAMVKVLKVFLDEKSLAAESKGKPSARLMSFEEIEQITGMSSADIAIGLRSLIETGFVVTKEGAEGEETFKLNDDPLFEELIQRLASFAESHWQKEMKSD